jgi:type VI secretion system Hcp family effector
MATARNGFVKFGSFEGEATDKKHANWSILYSVSAPITRATGGFEQSERAVGSTAVSNVVVVKDLDSESVKLQKACATGQLLPTVQVDLCTTVAGGTSPFLTYAFENVIITHYDLQDPRTPDQLLPMEKVAFTYTKATWTYVKYGDDGSSKGKVSESYTIGSTSGS